jgi:FAD/FMN-containing dehydrogenase/Fe-S oxidoreductase/molybdopterin-guanine dinucleotide biosynthesis protein A
VIVGGIVLCGGQSRRMGRPKAELPFAGEPMLRRVVRLLSEAVAPVVVVAAPGQQVPSLPAGVEIVRDAVAGRGPLQGLAAGLEALQGRVEAAYLSGCDVPLLRPAFVRRLIDLLGQQAICVPRVAGQLHPLAAVYRIDVLSVVHSLLAGGQLRLLSLFEKVPTRVVEAEALADVDPAFLSLRNVNTPADYEAALQEAALQASGRRRASLSLPLVAGQAGEIDVLGLRSALAETIAGEVRFDRLSRGLYATDASIYQIVPLGVVLPQTEADIVATVKACARFGVPLTARGGGTSQAGQAIGPGVILDCSKYFNRILEINTAQRWARVQPGCVLDDLNAQLRPLGLHFAPDISTSDRATLGGMIANNSSGTRSLIYGKTINHVIELKAVLADGSIVHFGPAYHGYPSRGSQREAELYRTVCRLAALNAEEIERRYPKILRRVGGYNLDLFTPKRARHGCNLAHLLVGSEGTLALILEAKLGLVELPPARAVLVIQFGDLLDALAATPLILAHGPSAVEVIDKYVLDATKLNAEAARLRGFLQGDPAAILIVEFYGETSAGLARRLTSLQDNLRRQGMGQHYHPALDPAEQARIWKLRRLALGLSMAEKGDAKALSFVEDTAVAPEKLRDYIAEFQQILARHGTAAGVYAHASVGCLHVRPVINLKTGEGVRRFEQIASEVADLVLKYGGALSGEHGDGLVRSPFQEKMFGPALYAAFREIKRAFDPRGLLNPGKIVDAPPLTASLRYGPSCVTPEVPTLFDFSADGGMVRAAELCSGVGECRKTRAGTMCPSYQATHEEQHSTRGRANTLRLALTGQLGFDGLTDPAVHAALDLCLECKACKSECPTNVDMARLKAEFLYQYYREKGLPLRNRLFGHVAKWTRRGGRWGNWWIRSWLGRWLNEWLLGIDRRRLPPRLAQQNFIQHLLAGPEDWLQEAGPEQPRILLFPDTFMLWYEPHIGLSALSLLRRAGYHALPGWPETLTRQAPGSTSAIQKVLQPWGLVCCGRPMISNGLLEDAVAHARINVQKLYPFAANGVALTACEPSCILTLKDDYPALLRGQERRQAEIVAAACRTFEEALEQRPGLSWQTGPKQIFVQAHCHQRALVGAGPLLRLLRRIPGTEVTDLDAGCCGMAGSFGYEKEHYEISRLVGEQRLFPALRQAEAGTVIVAPGFSCRMQLAHFTGRLARHPAELLDELLPAKEQT